MLINQIKDQCKDKGKLFEIGKLFLIEENLNQHSDFLTTSWMINQLQSQRKVVLITFRQNYAHFLSLSKKLGKSIEQYLKSKQLKYFECFQSSFLSSQLPLTQTSPNSYISPPTSVIKVKLEELMKKQNIFQENCTVIVDAISFIGDQDNSIIFKIYEEAMDRNCKLILGGAIEGSKMSQLFRPQSDLFIKLQNDVGNYGKFRLLSANWELSILWKHVQGKFELTQYIKL